MDTRELPAPLATRRLYLRPCDGDAAAALQALMAHEDEWREWQLLRATLAAEPETTRAWIIEREGRPLGAIALMGIIDACAETGFMVLAAERRAGHASEALDAVMRYAFEDLRIHRLAAATLAGNPAPGRLLARRGFQREGLLRGACPDGDRHLDCVLYARLASDPPPDLPQYLTQYLTPDLTQYLTLTPASDPCGAASSRHPSRRSGGRPAS